MTKVYGNDNSVYLTAKLSKFTTRTGSADQLVISGVDNVVTGVKNVSLVTYDKGFASGATTPDVGRG